MQHGHAHVRRVRRASLTRGSFAALAVLAALLPLFAPRRQVSIMVAIPCATPAEGAAPKPEARKLAGIEAGNLWIAEPARRITAAKVEPEALRTTPCLVPCLACSSRRTGEPASVGDLDPFSAGDCAAAELDGRNMAEAFACSREIARVQWVRRKITRGKYEEAARYALSGGPCVIKEGFLSLCSDSTS